MGAEALFVFLSNSLFHLVGAVVSTYGGWHPAFAQWWRGAVRAAAELSGSSMHAAGMLWRTVDFLSVTLQRQNFLVLAGCAPTLATQVEGLLGRPLSEEPEFWRSAPDAAIQWGSEEFGLPPSPRDPRSHPEVLAPGERSASTGLLRASGFTSPTSLV